MGKLYCCSAPHQTLQHQQSEVLCRQSQRVQTALTELLVQHVEVVAGQSLAVLGGMCTRMYMYALQRPCPYCSVAYNNPYGTTGVHLLEYWMLRTEVHVIV